MTPEQWLGSTYHDLNDRRRRAVGMLHAALGDDLFACQLLKERLAVGRWRDASRFVYLLACGLDGKAAQQLNAARALIEEP